MNRPFLITIVAAFGLLLSVGCTGGGVTDTPESTREAATPTEASTTSDITATPDFGLEDLPEASDDLTLDPVSLPEPTGDFGVGRTLFHLTDPARPEVHTDNPDDPRRLLVEFWYPADPQPGVQAGPYMNPELAEAYGITPADNESLPHAVLSAPLSDAQQTYPVVIFNPGFTALQNEYSALTEDIASHGYVVIAIAHPFVTGATLFPGGQVAQYPGQAALEAIWAPADYREAELEQVWVPDTRFVMDSLPELNAPDSGSPFAGRLQLDTVALAGHSFGGWTAFEVCRLDERCAGAVSLDGSYPIPVLETGTEKPYLYIAADDTGPEERVENQMVFERSSGAGYLLLVEGSAHYAFGDGYFVAEARDRASAEQYGEVPPERMAAIVRAYVVAFLDEVLRGEEPPLLDGPGDDYPEVDFQAREPGE